jgi:hypothetical protein
MSATQVFVELKFKRIESRLYRVDGNLTIENFFKTYLPDGSEIKWIPAYAYRGSVPFDVAMSQMTLHKLARSLGVKNNAQDCVCFQDFTCVLSDKHGKSIVVTNQ